MVKLVMAVMFSVVGKRILEVMLTVGESEDEGSKISHRNLSLELEVLHSTVEESRGDI